MFENIRNNKIVTLEPKKSYIINDINLSEYDPLAVSTIITIATLFLISLKLFVMAGM